METLFSDIEYPPQPCCHNQGTSAIETEGIEAPPQENTGLDATSTLSSSGSQPKKTRDASFSDWW